MTHSLENQLVMLEFEFGVKWFALSPEHALDLAMLLAMHAKKALEETLVVN